MRRLFLALLAIALVAACRPKGASRDAERCSYMEEALGLGMQMVWVEGGSFVMGATSEQAEEAYDDEHPPHGVTLDGYWMAATEVTQAQWQAVMGSNPAHFKGDAQRPVESISWADAKLFCDRLSAQTGRRYALPTEAQWEYAARGGVKAAGCIYSGSNVAEDVAWYDENSDAATHAVAQRRPNELGLYDMCGNVMEWCADWYDCYDAAAQTSPAGPSEGATRVVRGGCSGHFYRNCRVSSRDDFEPSYRNLYIGFRVVRLP